MKKMNEAIDKVRREEVRRLKSDGYEPILKHSRWCLLKRPEKLTEKETVKRSELLLNWFRAKGALSAGVVEGFNNKVKLTMRKAFGFRTYKAIQDAFYHNLGKLPEPE